MVKVYSNYQIEIKKLKFVAEDGRTCSNTAVITFHDDDGEEVASELFGAIDINEVYNLIREGMEINLDNYYIPEFSLSSFRRLNGIEKKELVLIKGFSAKNAFFEAKVCTDFSFSSFSVSSIVTWK